MNRRLNLTRSDVVALALLVSVAVLVGFFLSLGQNDETQEGPQVASSVVTPTGTTRSPTETPLLPQEIKGLPLQKMEQIVKAYYRLDPTDIRAVLQRRMKPLLSAKVFKTLNTDVGMNSVRDTFRRDHKLIQLGNPDLSKMTVESVGGTGDNLWVVVPVTTQLYSMGPDGKPADPYQSDTVGVSGQQQLRAYFQLTRSKTGQFDITGFGDERSSP